MRKVDVALLGVLPPPLHGMASVNAHMRDEFTAAGLKVRILNTAPLLASLGVKTLISRLSRVPRLIGAWLALIWVRYKTKNLYLAVAGGYGILYDILMLVTWRVEGGQAMIHHHNWTYLDSRSALMRVACWAAGPHAIHVALCEAMAERLSDLYGAQALVLSNCHFVDTETDLAKHKGKFRRAGFLSNLTEEKGIWTVAALARRLKLNQQLDVQLIIAGPCKDKRIAGKLRELVADTEIEWRGAVYGDAKERFWEDIDVFVFPSEREAEPLVVWEALAHGCPVVALRRGCIPCQLAMGAGSLVVSRERFCDKVEQIFSVWAEDDDAFSAAQAAAVSAYVNKRSSTRTELNALVECLKSERWSRTGPT